MSHSSSDIRRKKKTKSKGVAYVMTLGAEVKLTDIRMWPSGGSYADQPFFLYIYNSNQEVYELLNYLDVLHVIYHATIM